MAFVICASSPKTSTVILVKYNVTIILHCITSFSEFCPIPADHRIESSFPKITKFPCWSKYKKSALSLVVFDSHMDMFWQKISKFPLSCSLSLYLPVEDCKYFPFFKIPFLAEISALQFAKENFQNRSIKEITFPEIRLVSNHSTESNNPLDSSNPLNSKHLWDPKKCNECHLYRDFIWTCL